MKTNLNEKEKNILDFINKQINEKGYPPSVREICRAVGFKSTSTVHGYLKTLEEKGLIYKDPSKPRALKVLNKEVSYPSSPEKFNLMRELIEVPIIGQVTAGQPILAVENIEDTFPLPVEFARNGDVFALRIKGSSMINAGILEGDLVIVRQQTTAENGDIVVALIDDEATVKRFYKEKNHFRLQPENDFMKPIIVKEVLILGKVIGVFRAFR